MSRVLACALFLLALGLAVRASAPDDFDAMDQAKQGLYVVDAYREGRILVPLEGGAIYPTKPPLMTWLSLAVALPRGRVDELAVRAPSAAAAIVLVWATVRFARRLGHGAALGAAVAIAANFHVASCAWLARTDMLLASLTTLATAQAFESYVAFQGGGDPRGRFLATAALAGLGTVAKSPIALAVPLAALAVFLLLLGELPAFARAVGARTLGLALLVYAALVAAWLVPAGAAAGWPFLKTLWDELAGHAAGAAEYASDEKVRPFYYAPAYFLARFQPWSSLLVLGALASARPFAARLRHARASGSPACFAACAFVGALFVFSCIRVKRADHVLPCYPWAAISVGFLLDRWAEEGTRLVSAGLLLAGSLVAAASVLLPVAVRFPAISPALEELARRPLLLGLVSFAAAPAGALLLGGASKRRLGAALAGGALAVLLSLAVYYFAADAATLGQKAVSVPSFCAAARPLVEGEKTVLYRVPPSVAFYLERSQLARLDREEALEEIGAGARAVFTDARGAEEIRERHPELAFALASGFYRKAGLTWRLVLLLPGERVRGPAEAVSR